MVTLDSFTQRIQRLRVARGFSERDLAQRIGMTVHHYESLTRTGLKPTCSLLVDLAEALDVSFDELTEFTLEAPPTSEDVRAYLRDVRRHREALTDLTVHQLDRVDQRLARLGQWLALDTRPSAGALEGLMGLMHAVARNEPLRACASRYARLVVLRCAGNKSQASQVLGISYHTLCAYLRYPTNGASATATNADATSDNAHA